MVKLPTVSGSDVIKFLMKIGFEVAGRRGSHVRLKKKTATETRIVVVPLHSELTPGTLLSIIRQSGLTKNEFIERIK